MAKIKIGEVEASVLFLEACELFIEPIESKKTEGILYAKKIGASNYIPLKRGHFLKLNILVRLLTKKDIEYKKLNYYFCRRCGRKLTKPESIARGYGKICYEHIFGFIK